MDSYDLIEQYRNNALRENIIITPNEAKDAIATDYAGNLLTESSAVLPN